MKILLVDDERLARVYIQSALHQLMGDGHQFYQANGVSQVMEVIERHGSPDICFMDYKMPLCNGVDLIHQLQPQHPETVWVLVSGYDMSQSLDKDPSVTIPFILEKPVSPEELADILRQCGIKEVNSDGNPDCRR